MRDAKIKAIICNRQGNPIGAMVIEENGVFAGHFHGTTTFVEVLGDLIRRDRVRTLILFPTIESAVPMPPLCDFRMGINGPKHPPHSKALARWTGQNNHSNNLCKSCLDFWLDNADEDENLEPIELHFFGERAV